MRYITLNAKTNAYYGLESRWKESALACCKLLSIKYFWRYWRKTRTALQAAILNEQEHARNFHVCWKRRNE